MELFAGVELRVAGNLYNISILRLKYGVGMVAISLCMKFNTVSFLITLHLLFL